jgi:hypothetical protein
MSKPKLHVIEGALAPDPFRGKIVRELAGCLPRAQLNKPNHNKQSWQEAQFGGTTIDDLVHCKRLYQRRPWPAGKLELKPEERLVYKAYGKEFFEHHFGRRRPYRGWSMMARQFAYLTLAALQSADERAGRKPRSYFNKPSRYFVFEQLADVLGEETPSHDNVFRLLDRITAELPGRQPNNKKRRKSRQRKPLRTT